MNAIAPTLIKILQELPPQRLAEAEDFVGFLAARKSCAAQADLIVSGDKHLHSLGGQYKYIRIVSVCEALEFIKAAG